MDEQRIQQLSDLLLVGEVKGSLKGNPTLISRRHLGRIKEDHIPNTLKVHRTNLHYMADFFALEDAISSTTRHAGDIQQLCAVNHVII